MLRMFFPLVFFLLAAHQNKVGAQIEISITTFAPPESPGAPNTFIATGRQLSSSLLASDTPALFYGVVSSNDVNAICQHIVNTGNMNFSATVHVTPLGRSGFISNDDLQVTAMEGCLAAVDGSGTEALIVTDDRQAAVVCPEDAGSKGCGVYYMGEDVNSIYAQKDSRKLLASSTSGSRKLLDCKSGMIAGVISGGVFGLLFSGAAAAACGPFALICAAGSIATSVEIYGAGGCIAGDAVDHVKEGSCFPGDATVLLANGELKSMAGLTLGDKVAVRTQDGGVAYEDIYAFGHKDASASGHYIHLSLQPTARGGNISDPDIESGLESRILDLTPLHFAQVSPQPERRTCYKRAQDIKVGDVMWVQSSSAEAVTSSYQVTGVSSVVKQGLYNPFTMSGTIIVNGVAASTHSDWFLDNTFDLLGLTHKLPNAYQTILSPVRALYCILGKEVYISLYHHLDALISIADFGTKHGGKLTFSLTTLSTSAIVAALVMVRLSKSSESN